MSSVITKQIAFIHLRVAYEWRLNREEEWLKPNEQTVHAGLPLSSPRGVAESSDLASLEESSSV